MLILAVISILVGAALGLRFRVLALLPAIFFAGLAVLAGGITNSSSFFSIVVALAMVTSGLQIGYLGGGVVLRYLTFPRGMRGLERAIVPFPNPRAK